MAEYHRKYTVSKVEPVCTPTDQAQLRVLQKMLAAYESGKETAREIDEQLAALTLQTDSDRAHEARRALHDWLCRRDCGRLRRFLNACVQTGTSRYAKALGDTAVA